MSKVDDRVPSDGPPDDEPPRGVRAHLTRLLAALQDALARDDEEWATRRGYDSWRSSSGWTVRVRDSRFDRRQRCVECDGTGRRRITVGVCGVCDGTGVVTVPGDDPDEGGEAR